VQEEQRNTQTRPVSDSDSDSAQDAINDKSGKQKSCVTTPRGFDGAVNQYGDANP
jgi:hypothetical protein